MTILNDSSKRRRRSQYSFLFACVVALMLLSGALPWRHWAHELDRRLLQERLMDALARWRLDEDWSKAEVLREGQDYRWRSSGSALLRIGHALGEAGLSGANTVEAMRRSYDAGMRLFEVDLWLEGAVVRCHHGPDAPPPLEPDSCRFDTLLAALPEDAWLVLDIKTDFVPTGERIVAAAQMQAKAPQIIFQLYEPGDLAWFNRWQAKSLLSGPIVTAYRAHRRIDHIAEHARRAGAVLTMPMERLVALTRRPPGLPLYLHPVHDCDSWVKAARAGADGIYTRAPLKCQP